MGKECFIIYKSFYEPIKALSKEKKGILLEAIFEFNIRETVIDMPDDVKICFEFFKNQFRLDEEKYKIKCEKNKANVDQRWNKNNTTVYDRIRPHTKHTYKENDKDKDKEDKSDLFFDSLWNEYPRREGRKEALRHYQASVKTEQDKENIQKAITNYNQKIKVEKIESKFIKMGSTFFNNWKDYVDYQPPKKTHEEILREMGIK